MYSQGLVARALNKHRPAPDVAGVDAWIQPVFLKRLEPGANDLRPCRGQEAVGRERSTKLIARLEIVVLSFGNERRRVVRNDNARRRLDGRARSSARRRDGHTQEG